MAANETLEQKLERYTAAMSQGVERSLDPSWVMSNDGMPPALTRFFFAEPGGRRGLDPQAMDDMRKHIILVLKRRRDDLARASALVKASCGLNDLEAVMRWKAVADSLRTLISVFESMEAEITKVQTSSALFIAGV